MQCKHANAKDQRNIQERTILQKGCKIQHKRSKTGPKPLLIRVVTRPNPWTPKAKREPNSRGAFGKNAKTQSYKNIVNYMTNEVKELGATAEAPAEDEE